MSRRPAPPRHFAVRRVNPFDGVLQAVETTKGRAYSRDGRFWQIQVLTRRPDHTWRSSSRGDPIEQFFNFGLWDAAGGLQRIPASPVMDIGGMRLSADGVIDCLRELEDSLPFPLVDDYECWATDHTGAPIALLATTDDPAMMRDMHVGGWHATAPTERGFTSPTLEQHGAVSREYPGPRPHAEQLERQVRQRTHHKAWFRRRPDGSGERVDSPADPLTLEGTDFPPLGLSTAWRRESETRLAHDYLAWLAPRLLMLQHIDDALRHWLETHACRQAVELAAQYRLIPRIVDREAVEAARVEARLRRAGA